MLTPLTPTENLGAHGGFSLTGYYKGLRQNAQAWDYFLTAESPTGEPFSVHAHALVVDGGDLVRAYGTTGIEVVLADRARRAAVRLIDSGTWERAAIHDVPVRA